MRVEAKDLAVNPGENQTLGAFLQQLAPALDNWQEAVQGQQAILTRYYSRDGVIQELTTKLAQSIVFSIPEVQNSASSKKALHRVTNFVYRRIDGSLKNSAALEEKSEGFWDRAMIANKKVSPEKLAQLNAIHQEIRESVQNFHQVMSPINRVERAKTEIINQELSLWLKADFNHLLDLATASNQPDSQMVMLLRFLGSDHWSILTDAIPVVRKQELTNPNHQRFVAFLDQMAADYYRQGKNNHLWPLIEFFLPMPTQTMKSIYHQTIDLERRQREVFAPLLQQISQLQKSLPQLIKDQYAIFLTHLQETALTKLREASARFKIKELKLGPAQNGQEEFILEDNGEDQPEEKAPATPAPTPVEKLTPTKTVFINGQVCHDEQTIKVALEELIAKQIKQFPTKNLDDYIKVLAKLTGLRPNAPKHELIKKLTGFPKIPLSDNTEEAVLRLRVASKPLRLFIAFHNDFLIIIGASIKDDNVYTELIRKGGFSQINLPS